MPSVLNYEIAKEIRGRYPACFMTDLAKEYGVGISAIYNIIHNRTWKPKTTKIETVTQPMTQSRS